MILLVVVLRYEKSLRKAEKVIKQCQIAQPQQALFQKLQLYVNFSCNNSDLEIRVA